MENKLFRFPAYICKLERMYVCVFFALHNLFAQFPSLMGSWIQIERKRKEGKTNYELCGMCL